MRASAGLIALAVLVTLATRIGLRLEREGAGLIEALWVNYRFFTIWTNSLIGLACGYVAVTGRVPVRSLSGLLLSITLVAVVYHLLLAGLNDYTGIDRVLDVMLHTVLPIGFGVFWLCFVPKESVRFGDIPVWLALPLVYCITALTRAQFEGIYPYPFLNMYKLGLTGVAVNIAGLLAGFALAGAGIVVLARMMRSRR